jgi:hypothetical protein
MKKKLSPGEAAIEALKLHALEKLEERRMEKKEIVLQYPMYEQPERDYEFRERPPIIIS